MKFIIKNSSQCTLSIQYVEMYIDEAQKKKSLKTYNHLNWKNLIDQIIPKLSGVYYAVRSIFYVSKINTNQFAGSSSSTREFQNLWFLVFSAIWWLKPSSLRSWLETGEKAARLWDLTNLKICAQGKNTVSSHATREKCATTAEIFTCHVGEPVKQP